MLIKSQKIPFKEIVLTGFFPSFLKKIIYRIKGYKIGSNVSIGFGSIILGIDVKIGDNVKIGLLTVIRGKSIRLDRFVKIGSMTMIDSETIEIGEDARINENVIIGGMKTPQSSFILGKRTIIMEYSFINTTLPVIIGDDTGIGGHCLLFTHGSWLNQLEGFPVTFAPITIGKSVWLPWRIFIMPGVTIGDHVVIGANSLVVKSIASNCLVAGSPAKVIKENYPTVPNDDQKMEIFEGFMKDFTQYLEYSGFKLVKSDDEVGYTLRNASGKPEFEINILLNKTEKTVRPNCDRVIICNILSDQNTIPGSVPHHTMVLDILNKTRTGTSDIGEEYVRFVSRYGLRFSRLD